MLHDTKNLGKLAPPLYGLILTGGKSSRMGTDKALLSYHGISHREVLYKIANSLCDKSFISLREDQRVGLDNSIETILDKNEYAGPFNGILSAHSNFPEAAWMVLACDLPLMDRKTLKLLLENRDLAKDATALATKETTLPEPLAAIWEPQGLRKAIMYLKEANSSCPRKFLLNSNIKLVYPTNDAVLANANNQEDYQRIKEVLKTK